MRLDAAHYRPAKPETRRLLEQSGYDLPTLKSLCKEIFNLPRFRRVYATNPGDGWPYMTPGQLVMFRCYGKERFVSKVRAPKNSQKHFVKDGWILVTCSGTVGRAILATKPFEQFFFTHDLIRIVPKPGVRAGYLAAYLSSRLGQTLLQDQYGGTIDHIEPSHIEPLPVPLLPEDIQTAIDKMVRRAFELRDEANEALEKAENLIETAITDGRSA